MAENYLYTILKQLQDLYSIVPPTTYLFYSFLQEQLLSY
ncbi:hypothetical protein AC239_33990 [Bacteroides fragilis]|nr:hypothetical protein AC239_33990 [Bacteroides fragilis]